MLRWRERPGRRERSLYVETPVGEFSVANVHGDGWLVIRRHIRYGQDHDTVLCKRSTEASAVKTAEGHVKVLADRTLKMMGCSVPATNVQKMHIAVPDGYQIVPVEPDEVQLKAGQDAYDRKANDMYSPTPTEEYEAGGGPMGYAYRAMLAAATKPNLTHPPQQPTFKAKHRSIQ